MGYESHAPNLVRRHIYIPCFGIILLSNFHILFIRFCQSLSNCGESILKRLKSLKKVRPTERLITTPLFLLRAVELGLSISDLSLLTIGLVNDMYTEKENDSFNYKELATQDDFDKF